MLNARMPLINVKVSPRLLCVPDSFHTILFKVLVVRVCVYSIYCICILNINKLIYFLLCAYFVIIFCTFSIYVFPSSLFVKANIISDFVTEN